MNGPVPDNTHTIIMLRARRYMLVTAGLRGFMKACISGSSPGQTVGLSRGERGACTPGWRWCFVEAFLIPAHPEPELDVVHIHIYQLFHDVPSFIIQINFSIFFFLFYPTPPNNKISFLFPSQIPPPPGPPKRGKSEV